ncbi:hypothetical protein ES703_05653 [subsurface metagenome]
MRTQQKISTIKEGLKLRTDAGEVPSIVRFQIKCRNGAGPPDVFETRVGAEWFNSMFLHRDDGSYTPVRLPILPKIEVRLCGGARHRVGGI